MAILLSTLRHRVRQKLRDLDDRRNSYSPIEVDQAICEMVISRASQLPQPFVYTPNAFTISAGASTFVLPTTNSAEYKRDIRIQLVSTGRFLEKLTLEEIQSRMDGQPAAQIASSATKPDSFALFPEADQELQGVCYPAARDAELCNLWAVLAIRDLRDTDLDTVTVPFTRDACAGIVNLVAADLLEGMPDDDLKLRKINPRVAVSWRNEGEALMYRDEARQHDLEGVGRTQRWLADSE